MLVQTNLVQYPLFLCLQSFISEHNWKNSKLILMAKEKKKVKLIKWLSLFTLPHLSLWQNMLKEIPHCKDLVLSANLVG